MEKGGTCKGVAATQMIVPPDFNVAPYIYLAHGALPQ